MLSFSLITYQSGLFQDGQVMGRLGLKSQSVQPAPPRQIPFLKKLKDLPAVGIRKGLKGQSIADKRTTPLA